MGMADDNPLLKALPPEVDYISYLTILEYNLTLEQLPVLHNILQDTTLTANIGWDLVHLLLPLLPESQTCLQDVARLGNPREVVLKVTEFLEALPATDDPEEVDNGQDEEEPDSSSEHQQVIETKIEELPGQNHKTSKNGSPAASPEHNNQDELRKPPSTISKFHALVDMLAVLHPRIKTKHPTRFLSTSLQSLLSAYATLLTQDEATEAVLDFIKTFAGNKRPKLPPRKSSMQLLTQAQGTTETAPDPEASKEPIAPEEDDLQQRLLQSFLTFVAEGYLSALPADDDIVAMSWSTRLHQHLHPDKQIPGREVLREVFERDDRLHRRDALVGQMLALARDLKLPTDELVRALVESEDPSNKDSDDLPSSASDVPLSRPGCLHLLCATIASNVFFNAPATTPELSTFPPFSSILSNVVSQPSSGSVGTEPPSILDSVIFLGSYIFETRGFGTPPEDDTVFKNTIQILSLLSANTPYAPLRYHAHLLASHLFHAHPNENLREAIIFDMLQHCPYENLKASAVGWLKDEILDAEALVSAGGGITAFTQPWGFSMFTDFLFLPPAEMSDEVFLAHQPFFLAVLNLYFLVLSIEREGVVVIDGGIGFQTGFQWLEDLRVRVKGIGTGEEGMVLLEGLVEMCRLQLESRFERSEESMRRRVEVVKEQV